SPTSRQSLLTAMIRTFGIRGAALFADPPGSHSLSAEMLCDLRIFGVKTIRADGLDSPVSHTDSDTRF
ncbi:MAG: hypothetical protein ABL908_17870, partial [Hyphomicrobium sp.]